MHNHTSFFVFLVAFIILSQTSIFMKKCKPDLNELNFRPLWTVLFVVALTRATEVYYIGNIHVTLPMTFHLKLSLPDNEQVKANKLLMSTRCFCYNFSVIIDGTAWSIISFVLLKAYTKDNLPDNIAQALRAKRIKS